VRKKLVEWLSDPADAVTLMTDVTDCGVVGGTYEDPPLPHPLSKLRPAAPVAIKRQICKRHRLFKPIQKSTTASADSGNTGLEFVWKAALDDVVIVITVSPVPVTWVGEKAHVTPVGSPEQANETD
jgi:hypothetical protein